MMFSVMLIRTVSRAHLFTKRLFSAAKLQQLKKKDAFPHFNPYF